MAGRDATCPQPRKERAAFCLLISFLVSSTILFIFTYQKYQNGAGNPILNLYQGSTSNTREVTIALHPENHARRPATTLIHHWNITKGYRTPDGVRKLVYLINGKAAL